jgi:hypothetical protein
VAVPRVSDNPAVQQQYAAQLAVTAAVVQALRALWAALRPLSSPEGLARYRQGVSVLVEQYAGAAASVATDFYRDARAEAGVPGAVDIPPTPGPPQSQVDASMDWALRQAEEQMQALLADLESQVATEVEQQMAQLEAEAQQRMEAAAQKMVTDTAREQVVAAVEGDAQAIGYRRVPRPDACYWCLTLAFRTSTRKGLAKDFTKYGPGTMGADVHYGVYKSRESAGQIPPDAKGNTNRFHDNCHCVIEPVFDAVNVLPVWLHDMKALYDQSDDLSDFRRRVRAHRNGETPEAPSVPIPAAANPPSEQIAALLDLFASAS